MINLLLLGLAGVSGVSSAAGWDKDLVVLQKVLSCGLPLTAMGRASTRPCGLLDLRNYTLSALPTAVCRLLTQV